MRLADYILANTEPILREWDVFARTIWPEAKASPLLLRDHAEEILRAAARDMATLQTTPQQSQKSKGDGADGAASVTLDAASKSHAITRVHSGFDLMELVAEYRALRASVIRLWSESLPTPDSRDLIDLTRFNESIDQSLAVAVRYFSAQMDKSREMFLGMLGHDLRNPLNAILLSAEALSEACDGGAAAMAAQITTSGQAMARMLADFLDFTAARLGRGLPITPARMDLAKLGREVVEECKAGVPSRTLNLRLQGDLVGKWDGGRIRQLLSNLIGNAIQHGAETTPIKVTIRESDSGISIEVQNEGVPIPPHELARIFDPLVQGPSSKPQGARVAGSMGLGLYIAREVVTAHGGAIDVQSSLATGTIFTASLPREASGFAGC